MRIRIILSVLLLLLLCLPGCAQSNTNIVGTWKIVESHIDGEPLVDMNDCYFYFEENNKGRKVISDELQFTFEYSYDGTTCVLYNMTYEDGTVEAGIAARMTVRGNKMTIIAVEDGITEKIILKRQPT